MSKRDTLARASKATKARLAHCNWGFLLLLFSLEFAVDVHSTSVSSVRPLLLSYHTELVSAPCGCFERKVCEENCHI
jgi:hypothetical protein